MTEHQSSTEPVLMPDLKIVDPHLHLWDIRDGGLVEPQTFLLDEALKTIAESGHNVTHSVFVECGAMYRADGPTELRSLGEVEFANGFAAMSASGAYGKRRLAHRIIGNVDLRLGGRTDEILDAHCAAAGERYVGVRFPVAWSANGLFGYPCDPEHQTLMLDRVVIEGAKRLAQRGLSLDLWCLHPQLGALAALADAVPNLTIVLDHLGTPDLRGLATDDVAAVRANWTASLRALAERPNVRMKLGGLGMDLTTPPQAAIGAFRSMELSLAWQPWIETAINLFGPQRSMFESNFPPDRTTASYAAVWNAFKRICAANSPEERDWLFHKTAAATYRIDLAP